jgi:hypothetical protein
MNYETEHAVRGVLFAYAWAIDTKDWAALGACFTEACDLSYGSADPSLPHPHESAADLTFSRRDDFVEYIARTHDPILSCHLMGASVVESTGEADVAARTYGRLVLAPREAGGAERSFESAGVYQDVLCLDEGVWRFRERHYRRLWARGDPDVLWPERG